LDPIYLLQNDPILIGPAEYACPFCDKIQKTKTHMQRHIRTHTGEKPFSCIICGHRTDQKSSLNLHLRTHTGEKPYVCKICSLAFRDGSNLKRHELLHTGATFQCNFCNFNTKRKDQLANHIQTIHPDLVYVV